MLTVRRQIIQRAGTRDGFMLAPMAPTLLTLSSMTATVTGRDAKFQRRPEQEVARHHRDGSLNLVPAHEVCRARVFESGIQSVGGLVHAETNFSAVSSPSPSKR